MDEAGGTGTELKASRNFAAIGLGFLGGALGGLVIYGANSLLPNSKTYPLLDAPFLTLLGLSGLVAIFYGPLKQMLMRGKITIRLGDKEFTIQDAVENIDMELESKLDEMSAELAELRSEPQVRPHLFGVAEAGKMVAGEAQKKTAANGPRASAIERIATSIGSESKDHASLLYHLATSTYKWRNLETLSKRTRLKASVIVGFARDYPDQIIQGRGRSGNSIFRLTEATKRECVNAITPEQ